MKNMFKFSYVLAIYTVIACVGLAFVYKATAPIIEATATAEVKSALAKIFPEATSFEDVSGKIESGDDSIVFDKAFVAKNGDAPVGMIVQVTGPTYAKATILVGVEMNRTIKTIKFMALSDTPGLGSKAADDPFKNQFTGKSIDDAFIVGKDSSAEILAISGATISSKGVSKIVQLTGKVAGDYLGTQYAVAPAATVQE